MLDTTSTIDAGVAWDTDFVAPRAGTIGFHAASKGLFTLTVVTDRAHQALVNSDEREMRKQDFLFNRDSQGYAMDGSVAVPAGKLWFIVQNKSDAAVEFHLKCDLPDK